MNHKSKDDEDFEFDHEQMEPENECECGQYKNPNRDECDSCAFVTE